MAGALQEAQTARDVQAAYLCAITAVVPAGGYGFYVLDPADLHPVEVAADVPDDTFLQRYEDEGRQDDPVLEQAMTTLAPVDSSRLPPERPWQESAVLNVLEQAGFYHSLEAPVVVDGAVHGTLNMARRRDDPSFSGHDLAVMRFVADQVGAALTRARRYEQLTRDALLLADALDAADQAIVITTVDGDLIFQNRVAARPLPGSSSSYLERARPVLCEALGELRQGVKRIVTALEHTSPARQAEPTGGLAGSGGLAGAGELPRRAPSGPRPTSQDGLVAVKAVRLRCRQDAVVSFLSHRQHGAAKLPDGATPLSPRERGIAELVSQGLTNRQIAELAYVSENTVKQHLKRIFAKLDVGSRAELVQAVWESSSSRSDDEAGKQTTTISSGSDR